MPSAEPLPDNALFALRNRLRLDEGLGITYISGAPGAGGFDALLSAALRARRRQGAEPPALPARAEPERSPDVPARPGAARRGAEGSVAASAGGTAPDSGAGGRAAADLSTLVPYREPRSCPDREALLAPWRERALTCRACGLCEKRNSVVWGEGSLDSPVMFIGEGPGRDEDEQGRPFVGRSGKLLTDIIEKGMRLARREVYIANVVKCRPPGNRDPRPDEVEACSAFLDRQIETLSPKVIVAVGGVAGCALLRLPPKSGGLRGRWHRYKETPLRVIFHPSYLLRQRRGPNDRTQADRDTWADVREVLAML